MMMLSRSQNLESLTNSQKRDISVTGQVSCGNHSQAVYGHTMYESILDYLADSPCLADFVAKANALQVIVKY